MKTQKENPNDLHKWLILTEPQFSLDDKGIDDWFRFAFSQYRIYGNVDELMNKNRNNIFIHSDEEGWVVYDSNELKYRKFKIKTYKYSSILEEMRGTFEKVKSYKLVPEEKHALNILYSKIRILWEKLPDDVKHQFKGQFIEKITPLTILVEGEIRGKIQLLRRTDIPYAEYQIERAKIKGEKLTEREVEEVRDNEKKNIEVLHKSFLIHRENKIKTEEKYFEILKGYKNYFKKEGIIKPPNFTEFWEWWMDRPENAEKYMNEPIRTIDANDFLEYHKENSFSTIVEIENIDVNEINGYKNKVALLDKLGVLDSISDNLQPSNDSRVFAVLVGLGIFDKKNKSTILPYLKDIKEGNFYNDKLIERVNKDCHILQLNPLCKK